MMMTHDYPDLIQLFENTFWHTYRTRLVKGGDEPIYLPASDEVPYAQIIFAHGYYASALHEIAHWLVAGAKRRELEDYGYWYCPDGRSAEKQAEFECVEIVPQAYEWMMCAAAGFTFNVSCDNLNGNFQPDRAAFQHKVREQVLIYLEKGLPERATLFIKALQAFYQTKPLTAEQFMMS